MDLGQQKALEQSGLQMFAAFDREPVSEILGPELHVVTC